MDINTPSIIKLFVLALLLLVYSCSDENKCTDDYDNNYGLIISHLTELSEYCYNCGNSIDTAIIRDNDTYRNVFLNNNANECEDITLPNIDFSENSILVFETTFGGSVTLNRTVTIDSISKTLLYTISPSSCDPGYIIFYDTRTITYNVVLVPKIEDDYKVQYIELE